MTPSQRDRYGCEAARSVKWRTAAPPVPLLKHVNGASKPWPTNPHPKGQVHRTHFPPPLLPLFHTRHAEESAERPHLVTIVRPCGQNTLRKVSVLLNRRGVVSFEQLLLDISEALGFPRWHRSRVTRLYTTRGQEVKGVCDFFRGEVAFVALGKARPELSSVQEALEELFPDHSHYRAEALRAWEKRLRPAPDKEAKADSGYSEGTDSSDIHINQQSHHDTNAQVKRHTNSRVTAELPHHKDAQQQENDHVDAQKCPKKTSCRKVAHLPNHLQRLRVRGKARERPPSVIGPFKHEESLREADSPSPILCENCLARTAKHPERINPLSGKVPLPPVSRKQKGSSSTEQEVRKFHAHKTPPPPQPINREEEKSVAQVHISNPPLDVGHAHDHTHQRATFDLPPDDSDVTLEDIERCYEIGHVVGDGNFAVVRECRRRDGGQTLAVKIVERSKLIGREHMMQNELSLLGSLCHHRIVRLFAHHHTHTHSYLVMELVSGGDLFEAISEKGKFCEAEAGLMVSDVSEALNYIHCKSIVHRDLKPENLLIEHAAAGLLRLKLGDFGLAMVVTEPVYTICGTPTYVAPEILCETGYGVAVDVWALGVILYILLCGFPPFRSRDRDQEELFQLIKQGQLHFLSPYWDPISQDARDLVRELLQPDPSGRLTAEQTLLHPWVKEMSMTCRQRALTDRQNSTHTTTDSERAKRLAQTNSVETTNKTPGRPGSVGEIPQINRQDEGHAETNKGREQDEDKPQGTLHTVSPQLKVSTPSQASPSQQRPGCSSPDCGPQGTVPSRLEIQNPGPRLSNTHHESGSLTNHSIELRQIRDPSVQTESPAQINIQTKQSNQQTPPSNYQTTQQTTAGQTTRHPPSSSHHQHLTSSKNFSNNFDDPNIGSGIANPPAQS
ncbi:uncharacterized protein V6R79_000718 [Siganus canaliculatus]